MRDSYLISLAGVELCLASRFPQNKRFFEPFLLTASASSNLEELAVGPYEEKLSAQSFGMSTLVPANEMKLLLTLASDYLLSYDRLLFHSVAFLWQECAWLIAAPSGVGKTTQFHNLKALYGNEIQVISGDNPVLERRSDGSLWAYPSPWNGKEEEGSKLSAPLGGIVMLEQAGFNQIERLTPENAVVPVFNQFNTFAKTEEVVHRLLEFERNLLSAVPVWKLENVGDLASSELLLSALSNHQKGENS